jgi:hypothetical protein
MRCLKLVRTWALLSALVVNSSPVGVASEPTAVADKGDGVAAAGTLKDLDGHFPFTVPADLAQWEKRAEAVRQQLRVALGIWPMPKLAEVKAVRHSKHVMDGYTVENVFFESLPGFYVTGNLYMPTNVAPGAKIPGVLCPHGHWTEARFYDLGEGERNRLLASGEERFESGARNHIQARCVQLARMGCAVFHWDMIGYCDSQQINFDRSHRFANQERNLEMNDDGWLLFSPKAEELGQSVMGLQTINTIQCVNFLQSLPEIDGSKLGITGASGGGTQTFIGAALDPRLSVAFPAVMVSTSMQGGCTCENACGLRVATGNIEIAALIAPRPMGMTAANDWTKNMAQDGFPQLQGLYGLYGKKENVALFPSLHYGHNYNHVSRVSMYGWFNQHWDLGLKAPVLEQDFQVLTRPDLTVWTADHPRPESGIGFERKLTKAWSESQSQQIKPGLKEATDSAAYKNSVEVISQGWKGLLGPGIEAFRDGAMEVEPASLQQEIARGELKHPAIAESIRVGATGNLQGKKALIVVSDIGSDALTGSEGAIAERIKQAKGSSDWKVVAGDLIGQRSKLHYGESSFDSLQPLVGNPRLSAAYTYGYNWPVAVKRTQQLLVMIAALRKGGVEHIELVGTGDVALSAAAAAFQAGEDVQGLAIDIGAEQLKGAESIKAIEFFPGSARYFGLSGLVLVAPQASKSLRLEGKPISPVEVIEGL